MGKKDETKVTGTISYSTSGAASRAYGELDDFMDQIRTRLDRVDNNFERILELGTAQKTQKERVRVMDSIQRDIEKINKDIYAAEQADLKKLHEEKKKEYSDQLLKLKRRSNKLKSKLEKLREGGDQELVELQKKGAAGDPLKQRLIQANAQDEPELIDIETADQQLVGTAALTIQQYQKDAMGRILKKTEQMNQLAPEMLLEIQKQNERIMKIDEKLNKLESTTQRTRKYISYFTRNFMTDRLIMILIILVVLGIVAVIVVLCLGQGNKQYVQIK